MAVRRVVAGTGTGRGRSIQTGIGPLDVRRPKVRDRATDMPAERKVRFTSNILPKVGAAFEGASMPCCRCSICVGSPRGISRKHCLRCSGRMRRTCRPASSPA